MFHILDRPSVEGLLRMANIHEEIIWLLDVLTSAVFVAVDSTEEGLRKTAKGFGINAQRDISYTNGRWQS